MLLAIAFVALSVVGLAVEWYVWDRAIWWHDEKRDPRNFPPPR